MMTKTLLLISFILLLFIPSAINKEHQEPIVEEVEEQQKDLLVDETIYDDYERLKVEICQVNKQRRKELEKDLNTLKSNYDNLEKKQACLDSLIMARNAQVDTTQIDTNQVDTMQEVKKRGIIKRILKIE